MAQGHDQAEAHRTRLTEKLTTRSRLRARLSPADREPHAHDQHRHPRAGRRQDSRRRSRRVAGEGVRGRARRPRGPGAAGVAPSRAGQAVLEIEVESRGDGALRLARAGRARCGRGRARRARTSRTTIEGRQRFPIQVRLERSERDDIERLGDVLVATPAGKIIPLGQVAEIKRVGRPERDRQRERPAARLRAGQRAGPRPRRLCRGSERRASIARSCRAAKA